ncbi:MAG: YfgM family protein [Pseudomonadales bacterium]
MAVESDEQWEQVKDWWQQNGTGLVTAVVLAVGGVLGYQAWENSAQADAEAASAVYEELVNATVNYLPEGEAADQRRASAISLGESIKADYEDTTYAIFAALHLAKLAVETSDFDRAAEELRFVLAQGPDDILAAPVQIRLARVLLAQGKPDDALAVLNGMVVVEAQAASVEELRGDIYLSLGQTENARTSYQTALNSLRGVASKPLLTMKIADLPTAPPPAPVLAPETVAPEAPAPEAPAPETPAPETPAPETPQ